MVETNPRYDPIIEIDPAYTQPNAPGGLRVREALEKKGGPVIQQIKETVPQFENIQAEFQDKSAQDLSKLIKPFYRQGHFRLLHQKDYRPLIILRLSVVRGLIFVVICQCNVVALSKP